MSTLYLHCIFLFLYPKLEVNSDVDVTDRTANNVVVTSDYVKASLVLSTGGGSRARAEVSCAVINTTDNSIEFLVG